VKTAGNTGATISGSVLNTTAAGSVVVTATITNGTAVGTAYIADYSITVTATGGTGNQISINVGVKYEEIDITTTGSDGSNVISKTGANSKPTSLSLSASGYTNVVWYVDGNSNGISGAEITLSASSDAVQLHSVTFTGRRNGNLYSQDIPFTVLD
jgi:hypothetical protein